MVGHSIVSLGRSMAPRSSYTESLVYALFSLVVTIGLPTHDQFVAQDTVHLRPEGHAHYRSQGAVHL